MMNIYEFNKIMSVPIKAKLITHFYTCHCMCNSVDYLIGKLDANQANISKHLSNLRELSIVDYKTEKKKRYYFLDDDFKKRWNKLLKENVNDIKNNKFHCVCKGEKND